MTNTNTITIQATTIKGQVVTFNAIDAVKYQLGEYVDVPAYALGGVRVDFGTGMVKVALRTQQSNKFTYEDKAITECAALVDYLTQDTAIAALAVQGGSMEVPAVEAPSMEGTSVGSPAVDETSAAVNNNNQKIEEEKGEQTMKTTNQSNQTVANKTNKEETMTMTNKTIQIKKGKKQNKAKRAISLQADLGSVEAFVKTPEGGLRPLTNNDNVMTKGKDGSLAMSANVVLIATENNKIEKMELLKSESAYIAMNESEQSRVVANRAVVEFEVMNAESEMVAVEAYDATNVLAIDFNGFAMDEEGAEKKALYTDHVFEYGLYVRKDEAPEDVFAVTSMEQLTCYLPLLDTPSQKRQAKVTFFAETDEFTRMDVLKGLGNGLTPYVKKAKVIDGVAYKVLDVQKNSTRLGLLGSASIQLNGFVELFGQFASKEEVEHGTVITTTTGARVFITTTDVFGAVKASAEVVNTEIADQQAIGKNINPTVTTSEEFNWLVNTTDGSIITDVEFIGETLKAQGLAGVRRNGKRRGWSHQFRMNSQVKGLNVVLPKVKEITGYDMILLDGAYKTDLVSALESGLQLTYHVMLTAATFLDNARAAVSPQAMNNLNLPLNVTTDIVENNVREAEEAMEGTVQEIAEKAALLYAANNSMTELETGEEESAESMSDILRGRKFGMKKFEDINPIIWKDKYAKQEIIDQKVEMITQHQGGRVHVRAKNNYMIGDLFAILNAIADGSFLIKEEQAFIKRGQVALALMSNPGNFKEDGERYFFNGQVVSIRSPHVVHEETQKATAIDVSGIEYYKEALAGGFLDGLTMFSSIDLMVPASSGADFDGDTSLVIIDERVVSNVTDSPQYLNFFTEEGRAYKYNAQGQLEGAYYVEVEGKKRYVEKEELAELHGNHENLLVDTSSEVLGEGCPWTSPVPAPKFDLPADYKQDGYAILVPADKVDSDEAYKVWMNAIHKVVKQAIQPSDIGRMSNIVMALTNGLNFVKDEIIRKDIEGDEGAVMLLKEEKEHMEKVLKVFTAVVWWAIDAAKHGGAYAEILKHWIAWALDNKEMKKEARKQTPKSVKRILGAVPKSVDAESGQVTTKLGIVLPNALRENKFKFAATKGGMRTNLQQYTDFVKKLTVEAKKEKDALKATDNNIIELPLAILEGSTFPTKEAQELYNYAAAELGKAQLELSKTRAQFAALTEAALADRAINFKAMNTSRQNAQIKKAYPQYNVARTNYNARLSTLRHQLRFEVLRRGWDVVKFTAASYVAAYQETMNAETTNRGRKNAFLTLWELLEEEMMILLGSVEGAKLRFGNAQVMDTRMHNIDSIYVAFGEEKFNPAKPMNLQRGVFIFKGEVLLANEAGNKPEVNGKLGDLAGDTKFKFVHDFVYFIPNGALELNRATDKGVNYKVSYMTFRSLETVVEEVNAQEVYEVPVQEEIPAPVQEEAPAPVVNAVPVTMEKVTTEEFLNAGRFLVMVKDSKVLIATVNPVTGKWQHAATAVNPTTLEEGRYAAKLQVQVSDNGSVGVVVERLVKQA